MTITRYQIPEGTELATLSPKLKSAYTRYRPNQQRIDFFSLYEYFEKNATAEQQAALLIFELELIEQNYKTVAPDERKGWVYNTGSQVYTELHKCLGEVSVEERLIKINCLRRFVRDDLSFEAVGSKTWPTVNSLLDDINQVTRKIVQTKEKARINRLLHTMPDLIALKNNIKVIYDGYHSATSGRYFENPKREGALSFIDFIATTSDDLYGTAYRDKSREENEKDAAYMESYNTHRGMILYSLLQIKDEYNWVLSPQRSALFRECLAAAGFTGLDDISTEEKIDWLRALSKHIDEVRRIKSRTKTKDNKTTYDELIEQWKARKLPDLGSVKLAIEEKIYQFEEEKKQPSFVARTAKSATSAAAAYAFQRAALTYVTEYAIVPAATAALAGMVAGPVGMMVGGFVGPFIANRVGRMVSEKLIPAAVGNLCATLLDRIGCAMGDAAAAAAFALFSVSANGFQRLLGFYKEHINDNFDEEWVNTLLELPDDMVSAQDKQKIRKVRGLPEPQVVNTSGKMPKSTLHFPIKLFDNYQADNKAAPVNKAQSNLLYNQ
jgi:hypothetical protein